MSACMYCDDTVQVVNRGNHSHLISSRCIALHSFQPSEARATRLQLRTHASISSRPHSPRLSIPLLLPFSPSLSHRGPISLLTPSDIPSRPHTPLTPSPSSSSSPSPSPSAPQAPKSNISIAADAAGTRSQWKAPQPEEAVVQVIEQVNKKGKRKQAHVVFGGGNKEAGFGCCIRESERKRRC